MDGWISALDTSRPVIVYCVHGHQVGQDSAARLEDTGFRGMVMYDALYAWCLHCRAETHRWPAKMPA